MWTESAGKNRLKRLRCLRLAVPLSSISASRSANLVEGGAARSGYTGGEAERRMHLPIRFDAMR